jgi:hypothetical protein
MVAVWARTGGAAARRIHAKLTATAARLDFAFEFDNFEITSTKLHRYLDQAAANGMPQLTDMLF